jgi:hypothetical protein
MGRKLDEQASQQGGAGAGGHGNELVATVGDEDTRCHRLLLGFWASSIAVD